MNVVQVTLFRINRKLFRKLGSIPEEDPCFPIYKKSDKFL